MNVLGDQASRNPSLASRPAALGARVVTVASRVGDVTATVGHARDGQPLEVFLRARSPGGDAAAVLEAIARLASFIVRMPSPVPADERLVSVVATLSYGPAVRVPTRVRASIPEAAAAAISLAWAHPIRSPSGASRIEGDPPGGSATAPAVRAGGDGRDASPVRV